MIVQEYKLLSHNYCSALSEIVNKHLQIGWKLYGSPCVTSEREYSQAVVRDVEQPDA
jgi:hypothetical protein